MLKQGKKEKRNKYYIYSLQKTWEQTDKLVEDEFIDKSILAWVKAILLVILGISMLGLLAESLIHRVQNLYKAASKPSFFIAFLFVPFATNARIAISAISESRWKKLNVTSMTFSEIYGTVLMNNLLGFAVLSLIYFRNLSWNFSVEILMVLIVSAVVGWSQVSAQFFRFGHHSWPISYFHCLWSWLVLLVILNGCNIFKGELHIG